MFSTGFAVGFDRILLAMEKEGQTYTPKGIDAYVLCVNDDVRRKASEIVSMLRADGVCADIDIMGRKMQKALKYASSVNARYAVIVGPKELEEGCVTLRDMSSGDQRNVKIGELSSCFRC